MTQPPFHVLYEDNHLLAVVKEVGLATMGLPEGEPTLLTEAKHYIREKYNKPGNVYLGIVSRLDVPTSGVLLIARTSKAAARLTKQFKAGQVNKQYWAVVDGPMDPPEGTLRDWVRKDERHRRMHVTHEKADGAKHAVLSYRQLDSLRGASLLEVELETGRKHQIRLQMSHWGHPIIGDRKYGSERPFPEGIALHSRRLVFTHPISKEPIELVAPLPPSWEEFGIRRS